MRRRWHGFTIVELLVVISVIMVLIALLAPALKKARAAALTVVCQSNLRQIGVAYHMYANDYRGCLPTYIEKAYWPPNGFYAPADFVALGYLKTPLPNPSMPPSPLNHANTLGLGVWNCPAKGEPGTSGHRYAFNFGAQYVVSVGPGGTYELDRLYRREDFPISPGSATYWYAGAGTVPPGVSGQAYYRTLWTDGTKLTAGNYAWGWYPAANYFQFPHMNSANFLYYDGHVANYRQDPPGKPTGPVYYDFIKRVEGAE